MKIVKTFAYEKGFKPEIGFKHADGYLKTEVDERIKELKKKLVKEYHYLHMI